MSWENIHVGDYGWAGRLRIVQDGTPVDISSYTTREFHFRDPAGEVVVKTATFLTDGTDGYLTYTVEDGLIDTAGYWRVWAQIEKTGSVLTSEPVSFTVHAVGS